MPQILDHRGQPIDRAVFTEPQTARLSWLNHEFQSHPARNLTPAKLARILEDAEQGAIMSQLELWEDMTERDGHLFAEISKRQRAILTVEWDVVPPPNASKDEEKAAEAIKERLQQIPDLEDVFLAAAAAIGPVFSCQEIEWELLGRDLQPKKICARPNTWFTVDRETRSEILLRDRGMDGVPLWPFGWITHVHRAKPGYLARAGLVRQLSWPFIFKTYAIGDLAEFLEIHGLPLRVGTYPASATKDEKTALLRAVSAVGHDAAGIIPEGMKIEFQKAENAGGDPFLMMNDLMDRIMSKVILGGTLTSQADGKTSTNALGEVHNEVRLDLLASDARQIESTLSRDLVRPIGLLNGLVKDERRMPRLKFDTQEEKDFKVMAESIDLAVQAGVKVPANWAREQLRIPEPQAGEEVLERQAPPVQDQTQQQAGGKRPANVKPIKPADRAAASVAALAQALQQREAGNPSQAELDAAIDALDPEELQRQAEQFMAPIIGLIQRGGTIEGVLAELSRLYPEMSTERLETALANAYFVADLWGRISDQVDA